MANITAELKAIEDAVYGEEVRGSIHDAIQKINTVVEANETLVTTANTTASTANTKATNAEAIAEISFGNAITSQVSPVTGFVTGESYFNNVTNDLWKCNGIGWDLVGNLKGAKGDQGTSAPTISSIALTSKVGLVSTYTISLSDGSNYTFQVSDGAAGAGTGDMLKSDYDKNNNGVVDAAETVVSGTKIGQSAVLVELSEDSDGDLNYKGNKIKGGGGDPATASQIGLVKPDSLTTFVDSVGTLSAKPKFNTADSTSLSTMTTFDNVALITTDEAPNTLFNKLTNVVKNVRWLLGKIGADKFADISSIGDGTVTGAISDLNSKIGSSGGFFNCTLSISADSDLVGEDYFIYQYDSDGNKSPNYARSGKIVDGDSWNVKCLGDYGVYNSNGDEIGSFLLTDFVTTSKSVELGLSNELIPQLIEDTVNVFCRPNAIDGANKWYAFDRNTTTRFTATGFSDYGCLGYKFSSRKKVRSFSFDPVMASAGTYIKAFKLQGSNDDFVSDIHDLTETKTLTNKTVSSGTGHYGNVSYNVEKNEGLYSSYRLYIESTYATTYGSIGIWEMQLYREYTTT